MSDKDYQYWQEVRLPAQNESKFILIIIIIEIQSNES